MPSPASPPSAFPPPPPPATAAAAETATTPLVHYVRSAPPSAWAGALASVAGYLSVGVRTLAMAAWAALLWAAEALFRLLGWTGVRAYGAAAWPTRRVVAAVRFLVSPVTWTVAYAVAPVGYVVRFLGQFRPLYTFLGAAAFIGIVTGLVLKLFFTAMWPDAADDDDAYEYDRVSLTTRAQQQQQPLRPARRTGIKTEPASVVDGPPDDVWRWLQEYNPPAPAVAQIDGAADEALPPLLSLSDTKPRPGGLLSLTILEESSTE